MQKTTNIKPATKPYVAPGRVNAANRRAGASVNRNTSTLNRAGASVIRNTSKLNRGKAPANAA